MSKGRHVCFLTGTLNAMAGAERMTAVIANALAESGHTVSILSLWDKESCFPLHPAVRHEALFAERPSFKKAYLATVAGIRRYCRDRKIDVLVQVDTMLALFALPATVGMGVEHIAWEHCHFDEDLGRRARRFARRLAARYCKHVVVLTERDRLRWEEALRPRSHVVAIPNPLPFPFPEEPAQRTSKTVLAMGRLVHAKGFDVLIQAWKRVAAEAPDWKLVIHGEGEERRALTKLIKELGLQEMVRLPGICLDATEAYRKASIFCLSSRYEGFGLVLVEAMAFGLPIVSTDCETGPRELLEAGENAVVVPTENPEALANGLLLVIQQPDEAAELGMASRRSAAGFETATIVAIWNAVAN
ncbi:glycosyltransferase family 4 protein [Cupriavidus pinatubonensis]|uniref:GalNAc-alpha-(1->4)-GalNAc-alpha-(1->3)-diNAcBac-PP-undecaprenol alpha-1,4-N-acetyl-D-galactosaminyltransferase n=1 Tax=Cupriavidus pinatubonensis TaxID=248026 RepID=A0ABN7ZMQ7_9BURK|nr:glycosyltransferase family 4 protein [Cupriavidus pinatubonensis]CAG9187239.1 GalNAc-alpha-(1->4)-GalNAc-alpha-(1->3)-diNAcBac-PP-undecaprenol alpha-1,4-N-acetyl-D-galactosaminyltransferase [Cupriavidus pinatubonensis]